MDRTEKRALAESVAQANAGEKTNAFYLAVISPSLSGWVTRFVMEAACDPNCGGDDDGAIDKIAHGLAPLLGNGVVRGRYLLGLREPSVAREQARNFAEAREFILAVRAIKGVQRRFAVRTYVGRGHVQISEWIRG